MASSSLSYNVLNVCELVGYCLIRLIHRHGHVVSQGWLQDTDWAIFSLTTGFDSRYRRRSKYLSYPYTNSGPEHKDLPAETQDLRTPCLSHKAKASSITSNHSNKTPSIGKLGSKRFQRSWYRKFISCSMSSSPEFISTPSNELLSGLYSKAVDCMSPIEHKSFDLVEWFFCRYRISEYHDEAELATSLVNVNGGKTGKPVGNDLLDTKSEKKRKNNKMENAVRRRKMKSLSGLSDININVSLGDSLRTGRKLKQKRKVEEVISLHQQQNAETTLNESDNKDISVPEAPQNPSCLVSEGKAGPRKREKIEAAPEHQGAQFASYVDVKSTKCSSLVIDLQLLSPPIPVDIHEKSNCGNKEEPVLIGSNPEIRVSQEELVGNVTSHNSLASTASEVGTASQEGLARNITNHSLLINTAPEVGTVSQEGLVGNIANHNSLGITASDVGTVSQEGLAGNITNHNLLGKTASVLGTVSINKTVPKNRKKKATKEHLNAKRAIEIPDLNSSSFESCSIRKECETVNFLSIDLKSDQSRSLSACSRPTKTTNFDRVEDSGESTGTCLLLQFAPGDYIPSKEDLLKTFFRFGPLKVSETQLMKDTGNARIVFVRSTDAAEAFRSLEQHKPFGETLVGYKLHDNLPAAAPPAEQFVTATQPTGSMLMPGESPPPLQYIKQNLQMMTSVLESSGNNLSPRMRAKLDSELKNLLRKVNSRANV